MAKDDKPNSTIAEELKGIPHVRKEDRPDFSQPLPRSKLPTSIQQTIDDDEKYFHTIYEGDAGESTESNVRYAAYASRLRTALVAGQRYVAYTSDIGESFRPVAHPNWVRAAYGVSWAYLAGDVAHEGYKAYLRNQHVLHPDAEKEHRGDVVSSSGKDAQTTLGSYITGASVGITDGSASPLTPGRVPAIEDYRAVMAQRAVFQSIASMGLPAFTIHSIVKYASIALKNNKNSRIRGYGPIGLGLAAVPALPFLFDKPVEHAVEFVFHKGFELVGGSEAVSGRPVTGRSEEGQAMSKAAVAKEKAEKAGLVKEKEL